MARVKGPNGLTLDIPDAIAKGLVVEGRTGDYEYVKDESKAPAKKAAEKPSRKKSN